MTETPRAEADPLGQPTLFDIEAGPPISLADKFFLGPFSILDRRTGWWQDRKREWLSMGLRSEVGRGERLAYHLNRHYRNPEYLFPGNGTSIFDPVTCELVYRWWTRPGARILDPFAGGSVRGVVASTLQRHYMGVDLSAEQVTANRQQMGLCREDYPPTWLSGDSRSVIPSLPDEYDMVFSCPPYGDLEVYSDDPRDLSRMKPEDFDAAHAEIIRAACDRLRPDRFAAWVISDVRDKEGNYRGLVGATVRAFEDAGLHFYNEAVSVDVIGTSCLRAERAFEATRKLARTHQFLLVFLKGDSRRATAWVKNGEPK